MAIVPLLNKNNLPTFMSEFIGAAAKTLDKFDLVDNDGWLSTIPFGKLAGFLVQKVVEINNEKQALSHAVGFSCSAAFSQAMLRNALQPKIEKTAYQKFEQELKSLTKNKTTELGAFDLGDFWESPLVVTYMKLFTQLLRDAEVSDVHITKVKNYMRDYSRLAFIRLIRDQQAVYGKVDKLLDSDLYEALKGQYQLEAYRTKLKNQYTEITLNDDQGMTLDAIYQAPNFRIFEKCLVKGEYEKDNKAFVKGKAFGESCNIHQFADLWIRNRIINEKIKAKDARLLLLYGYPGQGKTSFCKRFIYDVIGDHPIDRDVYMIRLKNLRDPIELKADFLGTIKDHLENKHGFIARHLEQSLLILDGLDELLMKNNLQSSDVAEIFKSFREEIRLSPQIQILVTSRVGYLNLGDIPAANVLVLQLEEFDLDLQKKWLEHYLQFHSSWLNSQKLEEINTSKSHLQELVTQPILLHLIATLEEELTEDVNRARLYERLFDQITDPKSWKKEQLAILEGLETPDLRRALQEMAYQIWQSGDGYIHKSKVELLPSIIEIKHKLNNVGHFQDVLKVMMVAFYFQEVTKDQPTSVQEDPHQYAIEFLHKSLQEFLTAEYIWEEVLDRFLETGSRRDKSYTLKNPSEALATLQNIFGLQRLSAEIRDYLVEIIENHATVEEKVELARRLLSFFDYCLQHEFLHYYDVRIGSSITKAIQVFLGFWTILSYLQPDTNYMDTPERKYGFSKMLRYWGGENEKIDLQKCDLSGTYLNRAYLGMTNFNGSDLTEVSLHGANLYRANLSKVCLKQALLRWAYLSEVDLSGADLSGADLSGAYLGGADLSGADLSGADLSGADLSGANLLEANLSDTGNATPLQLSQAKNILESHGLSKEMLVEVKALIDQVKSAAEEE